MCALVVPFLQYLNSTVPLLGRLGEPVGHGSNLIFEIMSEILYFHHPMYPDTFTWFPQKIISHTCGAISICLHTYPKKAFVYSKCPAEVRFQSYDAVCEVMVDTCKDQDVCRVMKKKCVFALVVPFLKYLFKF